MSRKIIGVTVGTSISPEALKQKMNIGSGDGYSTYYLDSEVEYPAGGFAFYQTNKANLSNNGNGIKVGDIIIASNGTLCKVTSVSANLVDYDPIGKISGTGTSGGNGGETVDYDCVITCDYNPPLSGRNLAFSVVSGSLLSVWEKVHNGEKPRVLFRYLGEDDGDFFNTFAEADYVEHMAKWTTPYLLTISFTVKDELLVLESEQQSNIRGNVISSYTVTKVGGNSNGSGTSFQVGNTLKMENGILSVNTTDQMEQDNTLPITSAGVYATVGNIEALLKTI